MIKIGITLFLGIASLFAAARLGRFLIPFWLFLAAFAYSGRWVWLAVAGGLAFAVLARRHLDFIRRKNAMLSLAPPDADAEQQESFRRMIPEYEKIRDVWRFTRLLYPSPWEKERQTIANYLCLPPPPQSQAAFRDGLDMQERFYLVMAEGGAKKRFNQAFAKALIEHAREKAFSEKSTSEEKIAKSESDDAPIILDPPSIVQNGGDVVFELGAETVLAPRDEEPPILIGTGEYRGYISFSHAPPSDDMDWPVSEISCSFRFDSESGRFACDSKVNELELVNLESPDFLKTAIPWSKAPEAWKRSFMDRCILANVQTINDSRSRFEMRIGTDRHIIMTKYLDYRVDVALAADGRYALVRVHGLRAEKWEDDTENPGEQKFIGYDPVQPFCISIPVDHILPFRGQPLHCVSDAEDWDDDSPLKYRRLA
jgi:hypothetical protein